MAKQILSSSTFLTYSLGCRVNQAEISAISSQLSAFSFQKFSSTLPLARSPALILINTCAVTSKAERESRKAIHHFKRLYPKAKVVAIGCAAKFVKDADLVIGNQHKDKALEIIKKNYQKLFPNKPVNSQFVNSLIKNSLAESGRALVKIQDGCNNFCSYCIVPYLRSKPKSIPSKEIICKINKLVDEEIKEIILCGINLNLYQPGIINLLKRILAKTSAERITLSSVEPDMVTKEFANLFLNEPRLAKYFHLALQSGSQETIKNMARRTNLEKLMQTLHFIKEKCSEFTFRADVIVGFPTETEVNFCQTLDFIKSVPITFCHVFPYSVRPGTLAEKMVKNKTWKDLPAAIKKERVKKIITLTQKIQKEEGKKLIGKTLSCLIINNHQAIASNSWLIKITTKKSLTGKILPVKITSFKESRLQGLLY